MATKDNTNVNGKQPSLMQSSHPQQQQQFMNRKLIRSASGSEGEPPNKRFLLGNFVADRQRHIRELQDQDLTLANHLHAPQKMLMDVDAAGNISQKTVEVSHDVANGRIHDKYIACMVEGEKPNITEPVITFMEKIVEYEFDRSTECLTDLSGFLERAVKKNASIV